jgi:hypothetical protein
VVTVAVEVQLVSSAPPAMLATCSVESGCPGLPGTFVFSIAVVSLNQVS